MSDDHPPSDLAASGERRPRTPAYVVVGRITRPHGVRGTLRIAPMTDHPERFRQLKQIWLSHSETERTPFSITRVQMQPDAVLVTLAGIDDRDAAEQWRAAWVEIPGTEVLPLPEGKHYLFEIIGVQVVTEDGVALGQVVDILRNPAHDVYVVRGEEREYLIPAVPEFIRQIDSETGLMIVHVVDGLLEL